MNWDEYLMGFARHASLKSKDPSTKVGAAIVAPDHGLICTGFNGFPSGVLETPERWERPEKYNWVVHAELNAILHAAKHGKKLDGSTLYSTLLPCDRCAMHIHQVGIKKVVIDHYEWIKYSQANQEGVKSGFSRSIQALHEARIPLLFLGLDGTLLAAYTL